MDSTTIDDLGKAPETPLAAMRRTFDALPSSRKILLMVGIAAFIAIIIGSVIWSKEPEFRPLFTNLSDRDGGAVIDSLQKLNIPYKMADGGGAILVPANQVYESRLKLASQGLPKGGSVGFDLMDNMKIGVTQFQENVAYQRALEGEITHTIEAISAVQSARVHLAMPKETVFVREQQKPSASILVNLYPGRDLDKMQVDGIVHLVSSSVPDMPRSSVTIIDQNGRLLTADEKKNGFGMDSAEMEYSRGIEQTYVQRIENILTPITGEHNMRAQVAAELDFSAVEQTAESYRPNPTPEEAAVRSQQTSETLGDGTGAAGVPGALSNQPPGAASAPITVNNNKAGNSAPIVPLHKEATTNYELDKTISHIKKQIGTIKRLSVAVVVNNKMDKDKRGKTIYRPLTKEELTEVYNLTKEAMGFNAARGDTLNVVNAAFSSDGRGEDVVFWKDPAMQEMAKDIVKYLLVAGLVLYLLFAVIKPAVYKMLGIPTEAEVLAAALEAERLAEEERLAEQARIAEEEKQAMEALAAEEQEREKLANAPGARVLGYEEELELFKQMVKDDPKLVSTVIKDWVNKA